MTNWVKDLREQASLSQAALSAAIGLALQRINSIERVRYLPSLRLTFGTEQTCTGVTRSGGVVVAEDAGLEQGHHALGSEVTTGSRRLLGHHGRDVVTA